MKIILGIIGLYLLYKLIFDFIVPAYETTKLVKKKVDEMQERVSQFHQKQQAPPPSKKTNPVNEDYIDYEEVK